MAQKKAKGKAQTPGATPAPAEAPATPETPPATPEPETPPTEETPKPEPDFRKIAAKRVLKSKNIWAITAVFAIETAREVIEELNT